MNSKKIKLELASRHGLKCALTDKVVLGLEELDVDHIIPKSKGGSNCIVTCRQCVLNVTRLKVMVTVKPFFNTNIHTVSVVPVNTWYCSSTIVLSICSGFKRGAFRSLSLISIQVVLAGFLTGECLRLRNFPLLCILT